MSLYHILVLDLMERDSLAYILDTHSWNLAYVMSSRFERFVDIKSKIDIINEYHGRIYRTNHISQTIRRSEEDMAKMFKIDPKTFFECQKAVMTFDPQNSSKSNSYEGQIAASFLEHLKEKLTGAALYQYSDEELGK